MSPASGLQTAPNGRSSYWTTDIPPVLPLPRRLNSPVHVYNFSASAATDNQGCARPASHSSIHTRRNP
eukprot:11949774-Karenia_brevis.AAC.1